MSSGGREPGDTGSEPEKWRAMRSYRILGVPIADGTLHEAIAEIRRLLAASGPRSA